MKRGVVALGTLVAVWVGFGMLVNGWEFGASLAIWLVCALLLADILGAVFPYKGFPSRLALAVELSLLGQGIVILYYLGWWDWG